MALIKSLSTQHDSVPPSTIRKTLALLNHKKNAIFICTMGHQGGHHFTFLLAPTKLPVLENSMD